MDLLLRSCAWLGCCFGDSLWLSGISCTFYGSLLFERYYGLIFYFSLLGACCLRSLEGALIFYSEFFFLKLNFTREFEVLRLVLLLLSMVFLVMVLSLVLLYFSKGSLWGLRVDKVDISDSRDI